LFKGRTEKFRRNADLESLLAHINADLWPSERELIEQNSEKAMEFPVVLIMGPLRSGTTLFMQWLANTGIVGYPTNMLSRFYGAPIIGAKIQLLLADVKYSYRDELGEFIRQVKYVSENGKTKGVLAPNEFWYFWRRFLARPECDVWTNEELMESMDVKGLKAELVGMMDVFGKPFAAKGMLFNYNISFLDSVLDKVVFVQMLRDPLSNIRSVLGAREAQMGSRDAWYSFDIPEKSEILRLSPLEQAAAQVACINRAVSDGLAGVSGSRKLVVRYEEFCEGPAIVFGKLRQKINDQGGEVGPEYQGPDSFQVRRFSMEKEQASLAMKVYNNFMAR